uniref:Uncharacterized protein n=1 Tax=Glossina austeni TaxID=7395 RepID=A0A1A9VSC3_GLOAU
MKLFTILVSVLALIAVAMGAPNPVPEPQGGAGGDGGGKLEVFEENVVKTSCASTELTLTYQSIPSSVEVNKVFKKVLFFISASQLFCACRAILIVEGCGIKWMIENLLATATTTTTTATAIETTSAAATASSLWFRHRIG